MSENDLLMFPSSSIYSYKTDRILWLNRCGGEKEIKNNPGLLTWKNQVNAGAKDFSRVRKGNKMEPLKCSTNSKEGRKGKKRKGEEIAGGEKKT